MKCLAQRYVGLVQQCVCANATAAECFTGIFLWGPKIWCWLSWDKKQNPWISDLRGFFLRDTNQANEATNSSASNRREQEQTVVAGCLQPAVTQSSCLSYVGSLKMSVWRQQALPFIGFFWTVSFCLNSSPFCKTHTNIFPQKIELNNSGPELRLLVLLHITCCHKANEQSKHMKVHWLKDVTLLVGFALIRAAKSCSF